MIHSFRSPIRSIAFVLGLACLGLPHMAAADNVNNEARAAAQYCFPVVESHQRNPDYLTKQGFVKRGWGNNEFRKQVVKEVTWNDGTVRKRKYWVGSVTVNIPGLGKSLKGTSCKVELAGDPKMDDRSIPYKEKRNKITDYEQAAMDAFIAVATKRGYKLQRDPKGRMLYFAKGDLHLYTTLGVDPRGPRKIVMSVQRSY